MTDFDFRTYKDRANTETDQQTVALLAIAYFHRPDPDGGMGYQDDRFAYGRIDPACLTCGRSDEYAVPWPCDTFTAALLGLGEPVPTVEAKP